MHNVVNPTSTDFETKDYATRPRARGKFFYIGDRKFYIKGVTYGTFAENPAGDKFPDRKSVSSDFEAMIQNGINCVRVYEAPPRWLLDLAMQHGLWVFVGLPWEQHIAFLADHERPGKIIQTLIAKIREIAGHPAIFAYAVGNEIPASIIRWHGPRKVTHFLNRLVRAVREADSGALVTYVNFPTTEYLDLPFIDFVSFNVYLEDMGRLHAYMARLQNLAGERPLVMAELGLDSRRNGECQQANSLSTQLQTVFEAGAAGCFVFAWTDEWHRGGAEVDDWDFGLTRRDRTPKPALEAVNAAYLDELPVGDYNWPSISVVICSFNGSRTIGETLQRLSEIDYPDFETIVIDDGSTDTTAKIAERYDVRLISTENQGLSNARNTGMHASKGQIIAYLDDDAYPDPHWLRYIAISFLKNEFAAVGGPNIAPPEDPDMAECVANAPGGPVHVLIDDEIAEHIPGCNMAFRAEVLNAIGGFDPQFRTAGDDIDVCWRIQEQGGTIGFNPAAVVWHHRRPSIRTYLRQQMGYAKAESLVARKWPAKYNRGGHLTWRGRLYGRGLTLSLGQSQRIYGGIWGTAPFQSLYTQPQGLFSAMPLMPEWYLLVATLLFVGLLGFELDVFKLVLVLGCCGLAVSLAMAARSAMHAKFSDSSAAAPRAPLWKLRTIVFGLHLLQPIARLAGRVRYGLGPWKSGKLRLRPIPWPREYTYWTENWIQPESLLEKYRQKLQEKGISHAVGGSFDGWDIAVDLSTFGEVRLLQMVEEHGNGKQLFRIRSWPRITPLFVLVAAISFIISIVAWITGAILLGLVMSVISGVIAVSAYGALADATNTFIELQDMTFRDGI